MLVPKFVLSADRRLDCICRLMALIWGSEGPGPIESALINLDASVNATRVDVLLYLLP